MTIKQFKEILKEAEEVAVVSGDPINDVLDYFRNNGINATPEIAEEIVDKVYGEHK